MKSLTCYTLAAFGIFLMEAIREVLWGKKYDHDKASMWTKILIQKVLDQLSDYRFDKYIVTCNIQDKCGSGLHLATSCHWDEETDVQTCIRWENDSMVCLVCAFSMKMIYKDISIKESVEIVEE
ncbi:uncharacterized protein CDAR_443821 [Caerostris darwini]|uniref:Uncharacterized protein n=1 Tax=Caerostris darwini TaxID=1538125 RepID=A0AAV4X8U9_9ARAC|nr:uncharacterized protein CDAR_443821 [Caerostris darwini]